jgi:hypothetical protein
VTAPADYDAVTMSIEPGPLQLSADVIGDATNDIVTALNSIGDTLSNLQLSWNGQSAAEADDFANQWMAAMKGLFGSQSDPSAGVMNQVIVALLTTVGNSSSCEEANTTMFETLSDGISSGSSGSDTAPIPAGTNAPDGNKSAVAEIDWTSVPS